MFKPPKSTICSNNQIIRYVQIIKLYDMVTSSKVRNVQIIKSYDMLTSSKVRYVHTIKKKTFRMYVMFQRTKGTICENH